MTFYARQLIIGKDLRFDKRTIGKPKCDRRGAEAERYGCLAALGDRSRSLLGNDRNGRHASPVEGLQQAISIRTHDSTIQQLHARLVGAGVFFVRHAGYSAECIGKHRRERRNARIVHGNIERLAMCGDAFKFG